MCPDKPDPVAPFEPLTIQGNSVTVNTEGKVLVVPTGNPDILPSLNEYVLNSNRLTIAESPFGGLKGSGSPDYAVGTVFCQTDGVYLTDTSGTNSTKTLTAGKLKELGLLTVDTTNHCITEEFVVKNTSTSNNPDIIDTFSTTTNWYVIYGTGTLSIENGRLKFVGNADSSGRVLIEKYYTKNITSGAFLNFKLQTNHAGNLYAGIGSNSDANYKFWESARFPISANINTQYILPINAPQGTTGQLPDTVFGQLDLSTRFSVMIGVKSVGANTAIEFYISDLSVDVARTAYVELQTTDNLADSSLQLQVFDGSAYQTTGTYKLDSSYATVGSLTPKNWKFADGTKLDDCYGSSNGRALFPKGVSGEIKTGSAGCITYSQNKGASRRVGMRIDLPPSDGGRTHFPECKIKIVTYYRADSNGKYSSTYQFSDTSSASTGLQNLAKPWIALLDAPRTDILPDSSGNGNNGTMTAVTMTADKTGNPYGAMGFNGTSSKVIIPDTPLLNPTTGLTLVAWVKQANTDYKCVIAKDFMTGYELAIINDVAKGYIKNTTALVGTAKIGTTSYRRIVFTYKYVDGVNNVQKLYVDGNLDGSNTTAGTLTSNTSPVRVGQRVDLTLNFSGSIYDVRVYGRDWSQAEVTADFNGQYVDSTGLVASWNPYQPSKEIDFFLHTYRPKYLQYKRDETGSIHELTLYPNNGQVYHGRVTHCNPSLDSNSNLIPNCLEPDVEGSIQKFLQSYNFAEDWYTEYDLSTSAIQTNDYSITANSLDIIPFAVSEGDSVSNASNVTLPVAETVTTATGNVSLVDVRGQTAVRVRDTSYTNAGRCSVYDTVTTGNTTESTWKSVYATDWVFTGDLVVDNGLIVVKVVIGNYARVYFKNTSFNHSKILPNVTSYTLLSYTNDRVEIRLNNTHTIQISRGVHLVKILNSSANVYTDSGFGRFGILSDGSLVDVLFYGTSTMVSSSTSVKPYAAILDLVNNAIRLITISTGTTRVYASASGNIYRLDNNTTNSGVAQGAIPHDCSKIYYEAESLSGGSYYTGTDAYPFTGNTGKTLNTYAGYLHATVDRPAGTYTVFIRMKTDSAVSTWVQGLSYLDGYVPTGSAVGWYITNTEFSTFSATVTWPNGCKYFRPALYTNGRTITIDYFLIVPTGLIEKHAKRALWNASPFTKQLKSSSR